MKRYLPFIIIAVVLLGGIGTFLALSRKGSGGDTNATFTGQPQTATAPGSGPAQTPADTAGLTRPNVKVSSPVVLEEYGDYQCPPCGALHPVIKSLESEYGHQLQVVFRHFPLNIHKNARSAAYAAEAARLQGKFWQMHDQIYRNQNAWKDLEDARPTFISYASGLGLNLDRFRSDMESSSVANAVEADLKRGQSTGVTGTPTVFIEGYMLRYEATNPDGLRRGINVMLQKKAVP